MVWFVFELPIMHVKEAKARRKGSSGRKGSEREARRKRGVVEILHARRKISDNLNLCDPI